MARLHGRKGRLYVQLLEADANAQPVAFLNKWTLDATTDQVDVSAFEDDNKVYVAGLPDATGTFGGWYDDATVQTYEAAKDGKARKFYLYPTRETSGQYWYGTALFDFHVEGGTGEAVSVSGNWRASTTVTKVG